jgi:DNA polymerase-4
MVRHILHIDMDAFYASIEQRLRSEGLEARTMTLKIRYGDFKTITRSHTLDQSTNTTFLLWQEAERLFNQWHRKSAAPLRLLGFGASVLSPKGTGQQLFSDPEEEKHKKIDSAFDTIRKKYGDDALRRGT